jgi:hypothetical protein
MKKLILASLVALMAGLASAQTFFPNFPTVNSPTLSNALQSTTFTVEEEFRQNCDLDKFFYEHTDFQVKYTLVNWADVFVSYRLIFQDKGSGWQRGDMVIPGFNLRLPSKYLPSKFGGLSLRSREEILLETAGNKPSYQLTEFLKYNTPWKFTRFQINPFVGTEGFFDCNKDMTFDRYRLYTGVDYVINKNVKGSLFYYSQDDKPSSSWDWKQANIFVAQVKFSF